MADIAKVRFSEVATPIGMAEVWSDNPDHVALAIAEGKKVRSIDYLYFPGIIIAAKGKKPASFLTMTASEFKDLEDSISDIRMPASVLLSKKSPLLNNACQSDDDVIRLVFADLKKGLDLHEANKPGGSSPVRKVEDYMVSTLANLFLIAAGTSGILPDSLELDTYMVKALAEAKDKAEKLGLDSNGQFRLKKAKESKDATPEPDAE
ncbi:MAG: hypothetical protein JHC33_12375 [Ignisphaera sp.]|nr:hypothetical protein [Ignisphaera sp.]